MASKNDTNSSLMIEPLKQGRVTLRIIGQTPMYFNAMSNKAKRTLLLGGAKKTAAEKKEIKHDPEQEFRDSTYRTQIGQTLLCFPAPGIKNAMATAALVTDGVKKTDVQRLIFLPQEKVSIWGKPFLKMDVVRSADMNKTPDVRTRAFLPRWAAEVDIAFVTPTLSIHAVAHLLSNAGIVCGLGDFRQEKGKGSYGTFALYNETDEQHVALWNELTTTEARDCQEVAMEKPETCDDETRELWAMLRQERIRRAA
jgi:hypothetical protein